MTTSIFFMWGISQRRRRLVVRPHGTPGAPRRAPRLVWLFAVGSLAMLLLMSSASRASLAPPSPLAAPIIQTCTYIPDPRTNASLACGDTSLSAFANVSVFFQVNVSESTNTNLSVTFLFDYFLGNGTVNPNSPVRTINVTAPHPSLATVNTTWTYTSPNVNFPSTGQYFVNISARNETGGFDPTLGWWLFPVYVAYNSPPFINGLLSLNSVSQSIRPQNPVIPLVYENVSVGDPDTDPVTLTWNWGDGTQTVNRTGALVSTLPISVTHQYAVSLFPLNQTPRYVDIPLVVWIDDGLGHNESYNSTTEFYIAFDAPPTVRIVQPTVGSVWIVGEPVRMVGNVTDPEGDPITAFWDFDNRTDSTGIGDPTRNQDANGTTATHAYTSPGVYNITLWATDGNKELCLNQTTCANFTTHWRSAVQPILVRYNQPPYVALDNVTTIVGHPTLLRVAVRDPQGDSMTVRWDFGDGTPDATNVTGTSPRTAPTVYNLYQSHTYTEPGNHTLTVSVSDGNATVNNSKTVFVQSFNLPPVLLPVLVIRANGTPARNNTFPVNAEVLVKVFTYDPENDTLNISIDWADGSSDNLTIDPKTASECSLDNLSRNVCSLSFSHVYSSIGSNQSQNFTVVVTVTDNQVYLQQNPTGGPPITLNHVVQQSFTLFITNYQTAGLTPWTWWDYSTLAVVLGIPSLLIARFAWKVRRERQEA